MKARATAIAVSVVALVAASAVHAAEYEIQLKGRATSDATVLDKVGDTVIGTNDTRGTIEDTFTEPINGRAIYHCRVVWTASKARVDLVNLCTSANSSGDKVLTTTGVLPKSFQRNYVAGTGKLAGIRGGAGQPTQGMAFATRGRRPAAPTSAPVAYEPERSGCPVSSGGPPRQDRRRFG